MKNKRLTRTDINTAIKVLDNCDTPEKSQALHAIPGMRRECKEVQAEIQWNERNLLRTIRDNREDMLSSRLREAYYDLLDRHDNLKRQLNEAYWAIIGQ